ncbi:MAG: hypothetical protein IJL87_01320 [Clostridia bacterium]|nr:hypothetical protein [Clostridia bacterium]
MVRPVLIINSAAAAFKAKEILSLRGINSDIIKGSSKKQGCSYNLVVYADLDRAERIIRSSGILIMGRGEVRF